MASRNVIVRLKAEIADFKQKMQEAGKATEQVGSKAQDSTKKASSALGQMGESFRNNREQWDKLANGMIVAGGAMTAVTGAVLATGISYNTLQQTSRAALTTMLGGAEAANAQMDKLDEFARTSPFSKSVFIDAQRQLIGFGMEAERVVPTLDAIQNAVAATGGSNQDIAELTRIIAQVGAAGKITATDLMQFGQRGVDAATLIGSQMGKTGAQIREEITAGTLGADEAIEALTAGMQERFGGAAEGVKNTFAGAMDRVKAAIRDVSSEFATVFVNPQGGGVLIDWTNRLADLLRMFQALPGPVKNTFGAIWAGSGLALLAIGSIIKLSGSLMDLHDTYRKLQTSAPAAFDAVKGAATFAAAIAAAYALREAYVALGDQIATWRGTTAASIEDVTSAIVNNSDLSGYGESLESLTGGWTKFRNILSTVVPIMIVANGSIRNSAESFENFDAALAQLVQQGHADRAADAIERAGISAEDAAKYLPQYQTALKNVDNEQKLAAGSAGGLVAAFELTEEQAQEAEDAIQSYAAAVLAAVQANIAASNSSIAYQDALTKATEAVKENGKNLDITTEAGRANQSALNGVASAALRVAEDNLKAGASTADVSEEMRLARAQFIETAKKMGASSVEAERMADEFGLTTGAVHRLSQAVKDVPSAKATQFSTNANAIISQVGALQRAIDRLRGKTVVIATQFSGPGAQYVRPGMIGITSADGNMLTKTPAGIVRAYASGGFFDGHIGAQQPQVRPYAGPKGLLWSEEGSGPWEAFISGHPAKRDRSLRIWLDVGRRLGAIAAHADGAVQQYTSRGTIRDVAPAPSAVFGGTVPIEGRLDLGDGMTAALRGVADFTQMSGIRSRMMAGVRR